MISWTRGPNDAGDGAARQPEPETPAPGPGRSLVAFRVLLIGLVLLAGLALASPVKRATESPAGDAACRAAPASELQVFVLPPGHPPIPGLQAQGRAVTALPPGHPPIDESLRAMPLPARPLSPVFEPPATVDL